MIRFQKKIMKYVLIITNQMLQQNFFLSKLLAGPIFVPNINYECVNL